MDSSNGRVSIPLLFDSTKVFPLSPKNQHFHSHTFYTSITKIKLSLYRYKKLQINSISYPSDKINYKSTSLRLKILKHFQKTPNFHPRQKYAPSLIIFTLEKNSLFHCKFHSRIQRNWMEMNNRMPFAIRPSSYFAFREITGYLY